MTTEKQTPEPTKQAKGSDMKSSLKQLEDTLSLYFGKKAPQIPDNIKDLIVKFTPWLILLLLIMALPAILFALGLGAIAAPFAFLGGVHAGVSFGFGMLITIISVVLELMALPGLFKTQAKSWRLLYYSVLVGFVGSIFSYNILGGTISVAISLWVLFQIKDKYTN